MRLYWIQKNNDGGLEIVSHKVLWNQGIPGHEQYVYHKNGSPDGSESILMAIACKTPDEAILSYRDFIEAKLDQYSVEVKALGLDLLALPALS